MLILLEAFKLPGASASSVRRLRRRSCARSGCTEAGLAAAAYRRGLVVADSVFPSCAETSL